MLSQLQSTVIKKKSPKGTIYDNMVSNVNMTLAKNNVCLPKFKQFEKWR